MSATRMNKPKMAKTEQKRICASYFIAGKSGTRRTTHKRTHSLMDTSPVTWFNARRALYKNRYAI